jgi:chondroitin 4-sulfotransferase 11
MCPSAGPVASDLVRVRYLASSSAVRSLRSRWEFRALEATTDHVAIVLPVQRAVYVPIPKVACSSLEAACADILGAELPDDSWVPDLFRSPEHLAVARRNGWVTTTDELQRFADHWKFAFVRNPWDRLVSCYSEKIREGDPENFADGLSRIFEPYGRLFHGGMSFAEFADAVAIIPDSVAEPHFRSQHTFVTRRDQALLVDFIGRFERLADDFEEVCQHLGIEVRLPHLLESSRRDYREYFTPRLRDRIGHRYHDDAARFGYHF